jgi:hypothetical protein
MGFFPAMARFQQMVFFSSLARLQTMGFLAKMTRLIQMGFSWLVAYLLFLANLELLFELYQI